MQARIANYLGAAVIILAFGALFVGRIIMYPVAVAPGNFFERVRAESAAWNLSHQIMTIGLVALIPAAIALARALRPRSPWLTNIGLVLTFLAGALGVGQFALDFAMLAAAQAPTPGAGAEVASKLREQPFVNLVFYKIANNSWVGLGFLGAAMCFLRAPWRIGGIIVLLAIPIKLLEPKFGSLAPRIALGFDFTGFAIAAWCMIARPTPTPTEVAIAT